MFERQGNRAAQTRALKITRLKALERLGLAAERRTGVFEVDPHLIKKLQSLGAREERYAIVQRTLKEAGLHVQPSKISLWSTMARATKGVVLGSGLIDDGAERHYLVLHNDTGRIV